MTLQDPASQSVRNMFSLDTLELSKWTLKQPKAPQV